MARLVKRCTGPANGFLLDFLKNAYRANFKNRRANPCWSHAKYQCEKKSKVSYGRCSCSLEPVVENRPLSRSSVILAFSTDKNAEFFFSQRHFTHSHTRKRFVLDYLRPAHESRVRFTGYLRVHGRAAHNIHAKRSDQLYTCITHCVRIKIRICENPLFPIL